MPIFIQKIKAALIPFLLMIGLGFAIFYLFLAPRALEGGGQSTQALFAASFPNQHNQPQALKQFAGKTIVLNFWATWCEPCREEMPELEALHQSLSAKNGTVIGFAIDEMSEVAAFGKELKVSYPLVISEIEGMQIAESLGNNKGVLPYTVIIHPNGSVAKVFFGRVNKSMLEQALSAI